MFEQKKWPRKCLICSIYIGLQFVYKFMSISVASKVYRNTCFFGESLKLESVRDHSVSMKLNVFYSTCTNVFYSCHVFYVFRRFLF